jgi:hypothetical protein
MNRIEVGYVCEKGGGHVSLAGMSDHGACGSHIAGRVYIELEGGMREPFELEPLAESMRDWVARADRALWASE